MGFIDVPAIIYQVGRADQITHKHDESGQSSAARRHLLTSMKYRPTARALYPLAVSAIPSTIRPALRKGLRGLKQFCAG